MPNSPLLPPGSAFTDSPYQRSSVPTFEISEKASRTSPTGRRTTTVSVSSRNFVGANRKAPIRMAEQTPKMHDGNSHCAGVTAIQRMENAMIEERTDTIMVETAITKRSKEPKNTLVSCIAEAPNLAGIRGHHTWDPATRYRSRR